MATRLIRQKCRTACWYFTELLTGPYDQSNRAELITTSNLCVGTAGYRKLLITQIPDSKVQTSKHQSIKQLQKNPFTVLAEAGAADNVKSLCKSFIECIKNITDHKLICRLREATLKAVLNILSKYFTTYKSS